MRKKDLKVGMIVQRRDESIRMVLKGYEYELRLLGYNSWMSLDSFNDNLLHTYDSASDIIKVWDADHCRLSRLELSELGAPKWTRNSVIKILVDDKEIELSQETIEKIRKKLS